jgi:16S rRNA (guanine(1405)-N(7))-methyltransferase
MAAPPDPLDQLVSRVTASAHYHSVSEEVVRRIGARELASRRSFKEAVRATRGKLHQAGGVYFEHKADYATSLDLLAGSTGHADSLRDACQTIMRQHASTRERLPILDRFYAETLSSLGPIRSVLDLGCGLNPLAIPWMPLAEGASYAAFDMYTDLVAFIGQVLTLMGIHGHAEVRDITQVVPEERVDLALLLKAIPCLEQIDRSAGQRLLDGLDARHIVVSFPVRSLGGYPKGMPQHYERHFQDMIAGKGWTTRRFEFDSELVFVVTKGEAVHGRAR